MHLVVFSCSPPYFFFPPSHSFFCFSTHLLFLCSALFHPHFFQFCFIPTFLLIHSFFLSPLTPSSFLHSLSSNFFFFLPFIHLFISLLTHPIFVSFVLSFSTHSFLLSFFLTLHSFFSSLIFLVTT